ncbi:MAG: exodeoxyribonuclease V subunit gamma, partial [Methylotetracoccus sp.]|nr:exodeoxyribonuclease V subunit gamma [Methylotetracoccus sp.]
MLKLYPGNRMERLAERLAAVTSEPLSDAFAPEIVVTQSLGMAHWLALQLAQHCGIAANLRFMLPPAVIWDLFRREQDQSLPERSGFDRTALTWQIFGRLPARLGEPAFSPLRTYLAGDNPELKRYQLASRIADLFDQYLVFRPDLIETWDAGDEGDDWQAELWRDLSERIAEPHRVRLYRGFLDRAAKRHLAAVALPQRLSVFGVCTLPPAHLDMFARIAGVIDVHLFFFNPCREYWGDLSDERAAARGRRWGRHEFPAADPGFRGNALLASLGQQGRDFFERLLDVPTVEPMEADELFEEPGEATLLARLQSDILNLVDRAQRGDKAELNPADDSVRFHVCHSPMREIEVLHDQLLALFDKNPGLEPRDVMVMAPDIEAYAPYIEAVFSVGSLAPLESGPVRAPRLPGAIADRAAKAEHPLLQAFLALLQLPASRLKASEVLALLQTPAIRRRYQLSEEEFERIHRWVRESGVRWGLDAGHRENFGLPPSLAGHTWEFGLERLFLGYALAPSEALYQGVAPFEDIEGQAAETLGKLQAFLQGLSDARKDLDQPRTPGEWTERLNALFDRFFAVTDETARAAQSVRDALAGLQDDTALAQFDDRMPLDVVAYWLQDRLAEPLSSQRFLTGPVTFCSLLPMRNVPTRVLCLLGMNDGDFPRRRKPLGFDRITQQPRAGDRSRRDDDRYLFLEALLSARETLYISYVGRNIRDNSVLLPSVVVSELVEYIEQNHTAAVPGTTAAAALTVAHPMQPFSARYFAPDADLFSYAAEWLGSSVRLAGPRPGVLPFSGSAIDSPDTAFRQVHIDQLIRFYRNPARYFLENRLSVFAGEEDIMPEDGEPFGLDALQHFGLKQELLGTRLKDSSGAEVVRRFGARGLLPEPPFDHLALERDQTAVEALLARLSDQYGAYLDQPVDPLSFDLDLEPFRLYGELRGLYAPGLLVYRSAKLKAKDRLSLWIRHLALLAARPGDYASVAVAEDR